MAYHESNSNSSSPSSTTSENTSTSSSNDTNTSSAHDPSVKKIRELENFDPNVQSLDVEDYLVVATNQNIPLTKKATINEVVTHYNNSLVKDPTDNTGQVTDPSDPNGGSILHPDFKPGKEVTDPNTGATYKQDTTPLTSENLDDFLDIPGGSNSLIVHEVCRNQKLEIVPCDSPDVKYKSKKLKLKEETKEGTLTLGTEAFANGFDSGDGGIVQYKSKRIGDQVFLRGVFKGGSTDTSILNGGCVSFTDLPYPPKKADLTDDEFGLDSNYNGVAYSGSSPGTYRQANQATGGADPADNEAGYGVGRQDFMCYINGGQLWIQGASSNRDVKKFRYLYFQIQYTAGD